MDQADLFGNVTTKGSSPKVVKMRWSFSRLGAFAACPRLGYYHYFGGSKRKTLSEPQKERIQFLKQLSAGHLVAGEIVHKAIRAYLINAREEKIWKLSQVISFANMLLDNAIQHTSDIIAGVNREYDHRAPAIIQELFYGAVSGEVLRDGLREKMRLSLEQFYTLPDFQPFRNG